MNHGASLVLHIPHSSRAIPATIREELLLTDDELEIELLRMTDAYTNELFDSNRDQYQAVVFPVSRLVVDPERFVDDKKEPMSKNGMGVIYTKTSDGRKLRKKPTVEQKQKLLECYYFPHHAQLTHSVYSVLSENKRCLIIDCHSFPAVPLAYESDQDFNRPDICVGTDSFHTPEWLSGETRRICNEIGWSATENRPFSGSIVPEKYYDNDRRVLSIMIEVRRSLYMDEKTGRKKQEFQIVQEHISTIIKSLADAVRSAQVIKNR